MSLDQILSTYKSDILQLSHKYGGKKISVFGSVARNESTELSDIDFLVDLEPDRSLFDLGGLQYELQELLGVNVDVVTPESLHWYIKDRVLQEAVLIQ